MHRQYKGNYSQVYYDRALGDMLLHQMQEQECFDIYTSRILLGDSEDTLAFYKEALCAISASSARYGVSKPRCTVRLPRSMECHMNLLWYFDTHFGRRGHIFRILTHANDLTVYFWTMSADYMSSNDWATPPPSAWNASNFPSMSVYLRFNPAT